MSDRLDELIRLSLHDAIDDWTPELPADLRTRAVSQRGPAPAPPKRVRRLQPRVRRLQPRVRVASAVILSVVAATTAWVVVESGGRAARTAPKPNAATLPPPAVTGTRDWSVSQATVAPVSAVPLVCPAARECYGFFPGLDGPVLARTTNLGRSWVATGSLARLQTTDALTCATTLDCVVVGQAGQSQLSRWQVGVTHDGGTTWSWPWSAAGTEAQSPAQAACPTADRCVVTLSSGAGQPEALVTSDGGRHWRVHDLAEITAVARIVQLQGPSTFV